MKATGADDLPPDPRSFDVPGPDELPPAAPDHEPPTPPQAPAGEPAEAAPGRGRRVPRWMIALGVVSTALLATVAFGGWYTWHVYNKLDRVPVGNVLSAAGGSGTNYLIVGTDSRDGLDAENTENADVVIGDGVAGSRSDTLVLLHMSKQGNLMMPIPRDLYLDIVGGKGKNRINTAIQGGPERLIRTVQQSLGVPVNHYVEVDFAGFLELVDAVGGITVDFDAPATDPKSGLDIRAAGPQHLDKDMALAYVRSRTYTRIVDGKQVVDPRGDLGRIERQQTFLRAVMKKVGSTRNPFRIAQIGNAVASNLKVDDRIGFFDALGLARKLAGLDPETVDLPTKPTRTKEGAAVLLADEPGATRALGRFK